MTKWKKGRRFRKKGGPFHENRLDWLYRKNRYCYYILLFSLILALSLSIFEGLSQIEFHAWKSILFTLLWAYISGSLLSFGLFFDFSKSRWDLRLPQLIDNQPRLMSINELTLTSYRPRPCNLQAQPGQPSQDYSFFDDLCCHFEVGLWAIPCPSIVVPLSLVSFVSQRAAAFLSFTLTVARRTTKTAKPGVLRSQLLRRERQLLQHSSESVGSSC